MHNLALHMKKKDKAQKFDVIYRYTNWMSTNVLSQNINPIVCEENTQNR